MRLRLSTKINIAVISALVLLGIVSTTEVILEIKSKHATEVLENQSKNLRILATMFEMTYPDTTLEPWGKALDIVRGSGMADVIA